MPSNRRRSRLGLVSVTVVTAGTAMFLTACGGTGATGGTGPNGGGGGGAGSSTAAAATCVKSDGPVRLTFWNWGDGMDKLVAKWNSANPDIQVDLKTVPFGNQGTYQNLFNALKAGTAPDIAPIEYDTQPSFRLVNGLRDISGCPGVKEARTKYPAWVWNQISAGNAVYGTAEDIGPLGLYYRKDLFDKAGIAAPTTWQEYHDAAVKLKAVYPKAYMTHFSQTDPNWLVGLMWQNGAKLFGTRNDQWQVTIDSPQARQVTGYWQKLIDEKLVATDLQGFSEALNKGWSNGTVLTWVSAAWGASTVSSGAPDTSGKWAVAPLPQWTAGGTSNGNWGGSSNAVTTTSKHPYEATKFMLWLDTDPEAVSMLIKYTGIYPAVTAGADDQSLTKGVPFYGNQKVFDVFKQASAQVDTDFTWGPTMTDTYRFLADGIANALAGKSTLDQALASTQAKTVQGMKAQGLPISNGG